MFQPSRRKVRVSGGFLLLTAWFALCNGGNLLWFILGSAALHECGHLLALFIAGGQLRCLRVGVLGAVMETDSRRLGYRQELLVVMAGPMVNLLLAAGAAVLLKANEQVSLFVGINLVLGLYNLLPIFPLDGGQALYLLICWAAGPEAGEWAVRWIGTVSALVAIGGLIWLMVCSGGSLWLLPVTGGLLGAILRFWSTKATFFSK